MARRWPREVQKGGGIQRRGAKMFQVQQLLHLAAHQDTVLLHSRSWRTRTRVSLARRHSREAPEALLPRSDAPSRDSEQSGWKAEGIPETGSFGGPPERTPGHWGMKKIRNPRNSSASKKDINDKTVCKIFTTNTFKNSHQDLLDQLE